MDDQLREFVTKLKNQNFISLNDVLELYRLMEVIDAIENLGLSELQGINKFKENNEKGRKIRSIIIEKH